MPSTRPETQPDPRESALAKALGLPALVARVMLARGVDTPDKARAFLKPDLGSLHDPFAFVDMQKAVVRALLDEVGIGSHAG